MKDGPASAPILVGADGSQAAANAVRWAIDEAIDREAPLRLVHVTGVDQPSDEDAGHAVESADRALQSAMAVVEDAGKPMAVDTEILWGPVSTVLVDATLTAALLCVGATGADGRAGELLGSTAAAVAENAHCPVAIIRGDGRGEGSVNWVVTVVNDHPDNDALIECALNEARLRHAPLLAVGVGAEELDEASYDNVDRRMAKWKPQYPDVHIHALATRDGIGQFLASHGDESVQLAVLGEGDVDQIAYLVWPQNNTHAQRGERSVLIVPNAASRSWDE